MILRRSIVALVLCAVASLAVFTPDALAHVDVATTHQVNLQSQVSAQSAGDPRTTPKSKSAKPSLPDVTLTNDTTLSTNTVLPEGTLLLNNTLLPAGTKFSNGRVLTTSLTLQSPVELQESITVPAGTRLLAGSGFPIGTIIPGTKSLSV